MLDNCAQYCMYFLRFFLKRSAVAEWLEPLGYDVEGRRKVVSANSGLTIRRLENSQCQPSRKWIPSSNQASIGQRQERNGLHFAYAVHRIL